MKKNIFVFLVVGVSALVFALAARRVHRAEDVPSGVSGGKIQVAASFYPLYFFAREIGGEKADVFTITPAGAEPHDYEPTPADIVRITESRLLIVNGGGLEAWGPGVLETIDTAQTRIVEAGEKVLTEYAAGGDTVIADPHVWLSPPLAEKMVDAILQGFLEADAPHADYYRERASALTLKLRELDEAYRTGLAACRERDMVTAHAAFGYLAAAYHLNQIPIAGLSPDAEPSARELARIAEFVKNKKIRFVFFENLTSPKLSETIAREGGAQTLVLDPLEGLSLQEEASGKNYFTEMYANLSHLKSALQCTP